MKKKSLILKALMVNTLSFSMLLAPISGYSFNDHTQRQGGQSNWARTTVGAINQFGSTLMQAAQRGQGQAQASLLMSKLQPKIISAQFFPHCKMPESQSATIHNVCKSPISSNREFESNKAYIQVANRYSDFYNKLISEAQNTPFPVGLQCLQEAKKATAANLKDRINKLEEMIGKINKAKQSFRDQNKKLLEEINDKGFELNGTGDSGQKAKFKSTDFGQNFTPECRSAIGAKNLNISNGFVGVRNSMKNNRDKAIDFNKNKTLFEKQIRDDVTKVRASIKSLGVQGFLGTNSESLENFKHLKKYTQANEALKRSSKEFSTQFSKIKSQLNKVAPGYKIPPLDHNFAVDANEFNKGAERFFKKKFIEECTTQADKGVALSPDLILKSLRQNSTNSQGTTIVTYTDALKIILDSDSFIEDKLSKIRALDSEYSNQITVLYKDDQAKTVDEPPFKLFEKMILKCETKYTQSETFSKDVNSRKVSRKKEIERAKLSLNELIDLEKSFTASLADEIIESAINCDGDPMEAGTCGPGGDLMTKSKPNFCIAHATTCAAQVQSCFAASEKIVHEKTVQLTRKADTYNQNLKKIVAQQESFLKVVQAQVLADSSFLKKFMPGATFNFPKDLFVVMPEESLTEAGVLLRGGKDEKLSFLDSLPKQIGKLKEQLIEQSKLVDTGVGEYIAKQKSAMKENKGRWEAVASECLALEGNFIAQANKARAQRQKAHEESRQNMRATCRSYRNLAATCGEPSGTLLEDLNKVAAQGLIHEEIVFSNIAEYRQLCDDSQNSKNVDLSQFGNMQVTVDISSALNKKKEASPLESIGEMCADESSEDVAEYVREKFLNSLPADIQSVMRKKIEEKLKKKEVTFSEDEEEILKSEDLLKTINKLSKQLNPKPVQFHNFDNLKLKAIANLELEDKTTTTTTTTTTIEAKKICDIAKLRAVNDSTVLTPNKKDQSITSYSFDSGKYEERLTDQLRGLTQAHAKSKSREKIKRLSSIGHRIESEPCEGITFNNRQIGPRGLPAFGQFGGGRFGPASVSPR